MADHAENAALHDNSGQMETGFDNKTEISDEAQEIFASLTSIP